MDGVTLAAVAVGLAMDALAVAVAIGCLTGGRAWRSAARVALHFGAFQAGMTLLGYFAASTVSGRVREAGGWIAAALLWAIGGHMLFEALFRKKGKRIIGKKIIGKKIVKSASGEACSTPRAAEDANEVHAARAAREAIDRPCGIASGWRLVGLSFATSIDAFGAGAGFAFLGAATVWLAAAVIGAVAAVLPGGGVLVARHLAERTGDRLARAAELAGAAVLIAIGVRAVVGGG